MMTKSEIAVLTVTMIGTLTAWLMEPPAARVSPIFGEPRIACSAPAVPPGIEPFGEAPHIVHQNSDRASQSHFWRRG